MRFEDLPPEQQEHIRRQQELIRKKPEEINEMCDSGMFNSIIEGYCRIVFDDLDLTDKLKGYSFYELFDFKSAADARKRAEQG